MADGDIVHIGIEDRLTESDCAKLSIEFDNLIQQADGRPDLKELALRAGKSFLNDLRNGREVDIIDFSADILERYMHEVYESEQTYVAEWDTV